MTRNRYYFSEKHLPHFLTCTVVEWLPVFTRQEAVDILLDSWRYLIINRGLHLYGYVVLENHLHAVAMSENLPALWSIFKSYTAKEIIRLLQASNAETILKRMRFGCKAHRHDRIHQFWQEGSHPQVIENEGVLRQKLDYIHDNPVKRGFVDRPEHWRWSSARNYAGEKGLIDIFADW